MLWKSRSENITLQKKPRTYRKRARKDFIRVIKKQTDKNRYNRRGVKKQLNYVSRNLNTIKKLSSEISLTVLPRYWYKCLLVAHEVYRQQKYLYDNETHRISDRIVSLSQPHVRPIKRGKAGNKIEFGAKLSAASYSGFSVVDKISWDAYNESGDLKYQAKCYRQRFGHYPISIHADKIYRTRENRKWCKENGIRLSGPALGRPKIESNENSNDLKEKKMIAKQDELDRIDIEGRFGHSKRRYGLDRVMAKLADTSESVISLVFLVMNLEKILRDLFWQLYFFFYSHSMYVEYLYKVYRLIGKDYHKEKMVDVVSGKLIMAY
jgi:hypothetical protein